MELPLANTSRSLSILSNLPLFKEMNPAEIERIAQGSRESTIARGETIFQRGDACNGFYVVAYGQVKLALTSPQGIEKVVELIGPGQSFGEAVMLMDRPFPVFAQTLADSLLLHISKQVVFDCIEREPAFARKMLAGLSIRLHRLLQDVESFSLRSSAQRVIGYLLQQAQVTGAAGNASHFSFPANKNIIASTLNITPETFSRVLHDLSEMGLVAVKGKDVHIMDVEKLRAYDE
jgi:CRP-like cAMP-binding protein